MPQDKESGAAANEYGRKTGRKIGTVLGARMIDKNSNACTLDDEHLVIKCARLKTQDIGVSYKMLERLDGIIGAFEYESGEYDLYRLDPQTFRANMRPTRSTGSSAGRVGLVRKTVFLESGQLLRHVVLE